MNVKLQVCIIIVVPKRFYLKFFWEMIFYMCVDTSVVILGSGNCESTSSREKSTGRQCQVFLQHRWVPQTQEGGNVTKDIYTQTGEGGNMTDI
jgi:hypothetical protein